MVSLWPWKGDDNSPASFERTLSTLSSKITQSTNRLNTQRQQSRRFKALWTLYSTFAYLLYSIILALVLGWQQWGAIEYTAVAGGPVLIYLVRVGITSLYEYRISRTQSHLDELQKQRDQTIEKLKVATKYNSTQQLLEKYGGESPQTPANRGPKRQVSQSTGGSKSKKPQQQPSRTGLPPPPTANIRRGSGSAQSLPLTLSLPPPPGSSPVPENIDSGVNAKPTPYPQSDEPGFAPNAFPAAPQYVEQHQWYDRLMDVLLGEDETLLKNRTALICSQCRLVNGQAPPGIRTLEEIGRWRCGACGAWNGVESETKKAISNLQRQSRLSDGTWESSKGDEDVSSAAGTDEGVMAASTSEEENIEKESQEEEPAEQSTN